MATVGITGWPACCRWQRSFAAPRLHLGYRRLSLLSVCPLGAKGGGFRGHEFHYAAEIESGGDPLFSVEDARCIDRGETGSRVGSVAGSFLHLIDRVEV